MAHDLGLAAPNSDYLSHNLITNKFSLFIKLVPLPPLLARTSWQTGSAKPRPNDKAKTSAYV